MLEPAQTDIDIWLVDDREVADPDLLDAYREILNPEETGRHQRFIFTRHRHQFLVSRALVRCVLCQYLDCAPAAVEFSHNRHGKPQVVADSGLQFNLTHTNGLIALAVTRRAPVGIDVEYLSRQADIVKLAGRYFADEENRALYRLPVAAWNQRFYDLWTLKEAYLKACGTGLTTPLGDFSFTFGKQGIGIGFSGIIADDPAHWQFWLLDAPGTFRLSVAVNAPAAQPCTLNPKMGIPMGEFRPLLLPAAAFAQ